MKNLKPTFDKLHIYHCRSLFDANFHLNVKETVHSLPRDG